MSYNREKFFGAKIVDSAIRNLGKLWESSSAVVSVSILKSIIWVLATGDWKDLGGWVDKAEWVDN